MVTFNNCFSAKLVFEGEFDISFNISNDDENKNINHNSECLKSMTISLKFIPRKVKV